MEEYSVIGLMSGTSLDGLDICYCHFIFKNNEWQFEILKAETLPYSDWWKSKLQNAIHLNTENLLALNTEYGFFLGDCINHFIQNHNIRNVDLIASHGHTVFHQPDKGFTLQIGDGRAIKIKTGINTIYDFRMQDVLLGGNGAPLVPIGDILLFKEYTACLNLGGFSNISIKKDNKMIAFDICPFNIVLNYLSEKLGKPFDRDGNLSKNGTVNSEILENLNALNFYTQQAPKSLGSEWVNQYIIPLLKDDTIENLLATFTDHAMEQIARIFDIYSIKRVLVTGGGTFNHYFINCLKKYAYNTEIIIPDKEIINYKEALIFGLMGVLKETNRVNVLSSATGCSQDHSSGIKA